MGSGLRDVRVHRKSVSRLYGSLRSLGTLAVMGYQRIVAVVALCAYSPLPPSLSLSPSLPLSLVLFVVVALQ